MAEHDGENPATAASTVLALRDKPSPSEGGDLATTGIEVLMVQRNAKGTFASNWVFPGGKVDAEDFTVANDVIRASRTAAVREAREETDLVLHAQELVAFSHWMPPVEVPRRFATWFFAVAAPAGPDGEVTIDGAEIVDHRWIDPADALDQHAAGEITMVPPTWITLHHLSAFSSTAQALAAIGEREPRFYLTKMIRKDPPTVAWHGDAGYESGSFIEEGPEHRLVMGKGRWHFREPKA